MAESGEHDQKGFLARLEQIPCARTSLLSGIATGVGFGFIRGLAAGAYVGFHWTMGSFVAVSLGTWIICRGRIREEEERMQVLVNSLPKIRRRRPDELVDKNSS